jgi:hypothetical protein
MAEDTAKVPEMAANRFIILHFSISVVSGEGWEEKPNKVQKL